MKSISPILIALYLAVAWELVVGYQEIFYRKVDSCNIYRDVTEEYLSSLYEFTAQVYKNLGASSLYHIVFSPLSIWIILAAIAEGVDPQTQLQMFRLLKLPNEPCVRLKYYQLATTRYLAAQDVDIASIRALVIDENLIVNPNWRNFASKNNLIDFVTAPIRYDPQRALNSIRGITSAQLSNLDLSGNSVLVDALDFNGLWTTAFSDAVIQRAPFYNRFGQQIGAVDLMTVKRRAKMGFVSSLNMKVLELPIGVYDRYSIIFALILDNKNIDAAVRMVKSTVVFEFLSQVQESVIPVEIAIPRFTITSEVDLRKMLESFGVSRLWTDPAVTRYMSVPAALPTGFVQRSTLTLDSPGLSPAPYAFEPPYNATTGLDPILGRDFIANQPFFFSVFDTETYSCLMASIYSLPTYTY